MVYKYVKPIMIFFAIVHLTLVTAITIVPTKSMKRSPANNTKLIAVFDEFLKCSVFLNEKKLNEFNKCIDKYTVPHMESSLKYVFKEFLFFDNAVSNAFTCDQKTIDFYEAGKVKSKFICFEVSKNDQAANGVVFFQQINDKYFIKKIQYETPGLE